MTAPQEQNGLGPLESYIAWRTVRHSEDQDQIAAALALALYPLWAIQKFTELDVTTPVWIAAALPVVETAYLQSQRVAAVYAEDVRFAELPTVDPLPMRMPDAQRPDFIPAARFDATHIPSVAVDPADTVVQFDPFPRDDASVTLAVNGSSRIKGKMPGPEEDLMYGGLSDSSGGAIRQAINGSRNATGRVVQFDRKVVGFARVTDGDPCFFCALLASRGAVFKKDSFNTGGRTSPWNGALTKADKEFVAPKDAPDVPAEYTNVAKVHDHCRCTLRPVYRSEKSYGRDYEAVRDQEAQFYFDQWEKVSRDNYWLSNRQQVDKFREQYKPFKRKSASVTDIRDELKARDRALAASGFASDAPQRVWAQDRLNLQLARSQAA